LVWDSTGDLANQSLDGEGDTVYFTDEVDIIANGYLPLVCNITAVPVGTGFGCALYCSDTPGRTLNAVDSSGDWIIEDTTAGNTYPLFTPMVQAVS